MTFYSRYGYLIVVFFAAAAFIAGGIATAFNLSHESASVMVFLFWGSMCVIFERGLDRHGKRSRLLWIPMEYLGYALIVLAILDIFLSWDKIARDWTAAGL